MCVKKATIKDIAKVAGVSPSTVSLCLRGKGRMNRKTRENIVRIAKKLHYTPNYAAKALVGRKSRTIGVIVPKFKHLQIGKLIDGIDSALTERGYQMVTCFSHGDLTKEEAHIEFLSGTNVDGVVIYPWVDSQGKSNLGALLKLQHQGVPLVLVDRDIDEIDACCVCTNNTKGIYDVVKYLVCKGHERIAYSGIRGYSVGNDRFHGYCATLRDFGVPYDDSIVCFDAVPPMRELLEHYAKRPDRPTAMIIHNASNAVIAYKILSDMYSHGKGFPLDIVGVDIESELESDIIPVYSMQQKHCQMGVEAADIVLKQISGELDKAAKVNLDVDFIPITPAAKRQMAIEEEG